MVGALVGTVAIALFPTVVWLSFFLREDEHPEPARLLIKTFLFGALTSIPVLGFQLLFKHFFENSIESFFIMAIFLALFEELFKFFGAYSAIHDVPEFDEPIDPMIYMVVAGLGFATIENILVISEIIHSAGGALEFTSMGSTMLLRFVGATLLHTLASALVGYYWAKGRLGGWTKKGMWLGVVVATVIHAIFNYLVYAFEIQNILIPSLFLVGISFFVLKDFENVK